MKNEVLEFLHNSDKLQSLPETTIILMQLIFNEEAGVREAVEVMRRDPALTVNLLKAANSARFGGRMTITSIEVAASRLGMSHIRKIIAVNSLAASFNCKHDIFRRHWNHSVFCAFTSDWLLKEGFTSKIGIKPMEVFTAALMHSCGSLALIQGFPELAEKVYEESTLNIKEAELEHFGMTSSEAGEILLKQWKVEGAPQKAVCWQDDEPSYLTDLIRLSKYLCLNLEGAQPWDAARSSLPSLYTQVTVDAHQEYMEKSYIEIQSEMELHL